MSPLSMLWLMMWFFVGITVFQWRNYKLYWEEIDEAYSAIGVISMFFGIVFHRFSSSFGDQIVGNVVMGLLSPLVYLIGANISRFFQFGEMSSRIVIYIFMFSLLLIMFWKIL